MNFSEGAGQRDASGESLLSGIDQALEEPDGFRQILTFHRMGFGRTAVIRRF